MLFCLKAPCTCTYIVYAHVCLLRDEATMHFDKVLHFLLPPEKYLCDSCTISSVEEEVAVDDGNYSNNVVVLQQQDVCGAICVRMCAVCQNGRVKASKLQKKCYKYQVLSLNSHLFCRRCRFVFRSWWDFFFRFNVPVNASFLRHPFPACTVSQFSLSSMLSLLLSFSFN